MLPDKIDCFNCIRAYGFNPDQQTCNFDPKVRTDADTWTVEIKKFKQQKLPIIDQKRNLSKTRLRRDFIKHGLKFVIGDEKPKLVPKRDLELEKKIIQQKIQEEAEKKRLKEQARIQAENEQK